MTMADQQDHEKVESACTNGVAGTTNTITGAIPGISMQAGTVHGGLHILTGVPEAFSSRDTPETEQAAAQSPRPQGWRSKVRATLGGRWTWALTGGCVGAVLGCLLTALVLPLATTPTQEAQQARGGTGVAGTGPAADTVRNFVSRATGACLDDSMDGGLRSYRCNPMSYQRWTMEGDGTRRLRNHATGACLEHSSAGLRTAVCTESVSQRWTVTVSDDASAEIRSHAAGVCLADSSTGLKVLPCDGSVGQRWAG